MRQVWRDQRRSRGTWCEGRPRLSTTSLLKTQGRKKAELKSHKHLTFHHDACNMWLDFSILFLFYFFSPLLEGLDYNS